MFSIWNCFVLIDASRDSSIPFLFKVLDANDNAPVFLKDYYTGSVSEDAKAGVVVTTVKAEDKDSAAVQGPIKYSLGPDADGMFVINPDTGVITTGQFQHLPFYLNFVFHHQYHHHEYSCQLMSTRRIIRS